MTSATNLQPVSSIEFGESGLTILDGSTDPFGVAVHAAESPSQSRMIH